MTILKRLKMKLKSLTIRNYRSFSDETTIQFPNINKPIAIVGHNNAGKSNVIDAILMVLGKKSIYGNNLSKNDFYNHNINEHIVVTAKIDDDECLLQADAFNKTYTIDHIKLVITSDNGYYNTNHILCGDDGKQLRLPQSIPTSKKNRVYTRRKTSFYK